MAEEIDPKGGHEYEGQDLIEIDAEKGHPQDLILLSRSELVAVLNVLKECDVHEWTYLAYEVIPYTNVDGDEGCSCQACEAYGEGE